MAEFWAGMLISFGVVFVAELGDKSQLLAMTFAARYKTWHVLAALIGVAVTVHLASAAVGAGIGAALPTGWINVVAGVAFLGFAGWTLRGGSADDDEQGVTRRAAGSAIITVAGAFLLAELGDKTMLATITLAAQYHWVGVWIGSTVGLVTVSALAIVVGRMLGQRLPEHIVRYGAAALFVLVGLVLLGEGAHTLLTSR
ncbi:TMEM165/GDT1 family protein [Actinobacteria bacterium YIM 96077]|uniref:GDT1 family protein n=1 Tax=Phytoactinopolyspora halophila TaxID=1981511 RepID=A0A329QLH7_9ACTN|nr:TMEM165/GDT1 family protein [Phytoactinopolyspora halophila]AYY14829.1 TMEM165/GDT1 family protein [Actinobacteria bacterium YIM 96077]RAW13103.1 UPF0016 domain-containing protein [Phytoactinopolyspora halophila]